MAVDEIGRAFAAALTQIMFDQAIAAHEADDPLGRSLELQRQADARYRERLRVWERQAPQRRAAELAHQRASQRRAAELGAAHQQPRIAACMEWTRPQRPVIG